MSRGLVPSTGPRSRRADGTARAWSQWETPTGTPAVAVSDAATEAGAASSSRRLPREWTASVRTEPSNGVARQDHVDVRSPTKSQGSRFGPQPPPNVVQLHVLERQEE